jgi:hypothetical protein
MRDTDQRGGRTEREAIVWIVAPKRFGALISTQRRDALEAVEPQPRRQKSSQPASKLDYCSAEFYVDSVPGFLCVHRVSALKLLPGYIWITL